MRRARGRRYPREMRRLAPWSLLVVLSVWVSAHGAGAQSAPSPATLRLATLMPRSAALTRAITLWNRDLAERTGGGLQVRVYWGGAMGDERTMVRRMRNGQLDAASLTATGLAEIHRPVLVMQMPGLFSTYAQVDRVRAEIGPELERGFEQQGFALVGWGDSGRVRLFSREPVRRPEDLRRMRPWVPQTDSVFREVLSVIGANGIPLGVGEVYGGLRTGMIDVAPGTALAVMGLQWFTSVRYATAQSDGFLVGGMVVRRSFLDGLPPAHRAALFESARASQGRFLRRVRDGDERAYRALVQNGMTEVTVADEAAWRRVGAETRRRLSGRLFPAQLLQRVERVVAETR
jgi:TRAP-type C4-dicarboxylate transport system substrate-binding protein